MARQDIERVFGKGSREFVASNQGHYKGERQHVVLDSLGRLFQFGSPNDEDLPEEEKHNCDSMGCPSVGPHILQSFIEIG